MDLTRSVDPSKWEYGLWTKVDTLVSFCGWAVFGSSWTGVRTGCRRILQGGIILAICAMFTPNRILRFTHWLRTVQQLPYAD